MLPLLAIVGATGSQGGSVLDYAMKSKQYRIRAITRDPTSASAQKLSSLGVEVVSAELEDEDSLVKAFEGSTAIYAMTNFFGYFPRVPAHEATAIEARQGINLAKAALKTPTLKHYIWSTLPNAYKISRGKFTVPHLFGKNQVDDFIKSHEELWKKTTFLWVGYYAGNVAYPMLGPLFLETLGKHVQLFPVPANTPVEAIGDVRKNLGAFTSAILAQPEKTVGRIVLGSVESTTLGKMLEDWSDATGKASLHVQLASVQEYENMWPQWGNAEGPMFKFWEEVQDRGWIDVDGVEIVTRDDLKIDQKELSSMKESYAAMN